MQSLDDERLNTALRVKDVTDEVFAQLQVHPYQVLRQGRRDPHRSSLPVWQATNGLKVEVVDLDITDLVLCLLAIVLVREGRPGESLEASGAHRFTHGKMNEAIEVRLQTGCQVQPFDVLWDVL